MAKAQGSEGAPRKGSNSAIKLIVFTLTPTTVTHTNSVGAKPPFDLNTVFGSLSVTNKFPFFASRRYRPFLDVVAYCLFSFPFNFQPHTALKILPGILPQAMSWETLKWQLTLKLRCNQCEVETEGIIIYIYWYFLIVYCTGDWSIRLWPIEAQLWLAHLITDNSRATRYAGSPFKEPWLNKIIKCIHNK